MSDMWFVDCVNCGKQVMIGGPADKCLWCGKYPSAKEPPAGSSSVVSSSSESNHLEEEVAVSETDEVEEVKVVNHRNKSPMAVKAIRKYRKENKAAMLHDYYTMTLKDFFQKWSISSATWSGLKKDWEVTGKGWGHSMPKEPPVAGSEPDQLTEHDHYLMLLGYQMAVREIFE